MKPILSRLAAVLCVLCLMTGSACAATTTILPEKENGYRMTVSLVPVGDTVYILTIAGMEAQLYSWNETQPEAETLATGLLYAERFSTIKEMEEVIADFPAGTKADAEHALSMIFTDGEKLYGFNQVNNLIFAIDAQADGLHYTNVAELAFDRVNTSNTAIDAQRLGKWFLWHDMDSNSRSRDERILAFNIENGTVKQAMLPGLQEVLPYKDDLVLAICTAARNKSEYEVYTYDPETDVRTLLGKLPEGLRLNGAAYSAEMDMIAYQDGTRVMGWHPDTGSEELGFIPGAMPQKLTVLENSVILVNLEEITARSIERGYAPEHRVLVLEGNMADAGKAFSEKYPEVPYYYEYLGAGSYSTLLKREADIPDLLWLQAADGHYDQLVEEGLLMDLSVYPDIKRYVDVLYPAYKELAMEGDAIYGVPVSASAYNGWFINKEVMNAMGLKEEDIPTSLTEMCAFADKWNSEYAEKYPHFTLLNNTTSYRERLLEAILISWADYCQYTGKELTYDDPIFREALAALEAASLDKLDAALKQTNPEISEYKQALIWTGIKTVGNWATYMEDFSDRIFIPLTLTPETPYTAAVPNVGLWVMNKASQNAEYAAALLAEKIAVMDDVHAYALRTDKTEPVLSEYVEESLTYERNILAALEESLEESVNRAAIEKRIEEQKTYIEDRLIPSMYTIVPSALENYRNVIAPASFVDRPDAATSREDAQIMGCIRRYIQGTYTMDEFITRLNELTAQ